MADYESDTFSIPCSVCSSDNENYEISARDDTDMVHSETVARSGNMLGPVVFNGFAFPFNTFSCTGVLTITGLIGAAANAVSLTLNGSGISPCFSGGDYYQDGSFTAEAEVPLSLTGNCTGQEPPDNP